MTPTVNLGASIGAQLLKQARETGDDVQTLLTRYCLERFLYRLGISDARDRFVWKGAMLLRAWSDRPYRATRDLDFLRRGDGTLDAIHNDIRTVIATPAPPDAVSFDADSVRIESIRAEDEYGGARATVSARCGKARLQLQIDIGLGDAVWPQPKPCQYPALLDFPAPEVLAYAPSTVVAEKFEAMVVLGDRNSRIKDFFDLHHLASRLDFDRATLVEAIRRTFVRRRTPIPQEDPIGLTPAYWENPSRPAQVRAFARRAGLEFPDTPANEFTSLLRAFLMPLLDDLRRGTPGAGTWRSGGPWR